MPPLRAPDLRHLDPGFEGLDLGAGFMARREAVVRLDALRPHNPNPNPNPNPDPNPNPEPDRDPDPTPTLTR
jgi:hypothetical protein